jgi:Ras homolog enriched in brain
LSRNASVGVHGYVLVFSVASRKSFEIIKVVAESLVSALGNNAKDIPRVLVGNMKDMHLQRQVNAQVRTAKPGVNYSLLW